jgi:organic radical activating enzyme
MIQKQYFEHVLTDHCNLRCENCSMHSPFLDDAFSNLECFKRDLEKMSKVVEIETFRFIGGEPTLHPQIIDFVKAVKESGIAKKVSVCTNGVNIKALSDEFFLAVDIVDISVYNETGIDYSDMFWFLRKKRISLNESFEFKQTPYVGFINMYSNEKPDTETVQKIYDNCINKNTCHSFKDGKYYRCSVTITKNKYLKNMGIDVDTDFLETDGLSLDSDNLEESLKEYLTNTVPLKACEYCKGTSGQITKRIQHTVQEIKFLRKS